MTACRWIAHDQPRLLRTHQRDCETSGCEGCQPCEDRHCGVCGIRHVESLTCPGCVGVVRSDLDLIADLSARMLGEAVHRGVNSEAAMLAGPAADVEAWRNRWMSARAGRIPADWLEDCRDELHPLYVLGTWDMLVTQHYDHDRTQRVTIEGAASYLGANLTALAQEAEFAFEELAREVRACRAHLEDVLRDGERDEKGAPCPMCGRAALVKDHGETIEDDRWRCPRRDCSASYTEHDYRVKVEAVYVLHADRLTASQIAETYRVPEGTVRRWASGHAPTVRVHGKDDHGRQLYDVADVLGMRDGVSA